MLTLTYRDEDAWRPRHVADCLKHVRHYVERKGHQFRCVWVAELTQAGRVHYHAVIWLPKGVTLPKPDKQGWWKHGSTRIEWARKPVGYLAKYASKGDAETKFPRGLRICGRGGLTTLQRQNVAWHCLPRYVRQAFPTEGTRVRRARGGGWFDLETGEYLASYDWHPPDPAAGGNAVPGGSGDGEPQRR